MRALLARSRFFAALDAADLDWVLALARQRRLRSGELTEQLSEFALRSLPVRLARRIFKLAEIYGQATPDGLLIDARISQQDLAGWVGTTR